MLRRLALTLVLSAAGAHAQSAPDPATADSATADSATAAGRGRPVVSRRDLATFGALVAAGAAVAPFDVRLTHAIRRPGVQRDRVARAGAHTFNAAGDPGALIAGVALWGAGRLRDDVGTARIGLHATEAIVLGGSTTALVKLLAGRRRPYLDESDADAFAPGRGFAGGRASFPSGHVTAAFAFASAVAGDLRATHPRAARVARPLLYGAATLVGGARMFDAKHWASDVAVGAAVGTLAGRVVTAYARAHPDGRLERLAGHVALAPSAAGGVSGITLGVSTR